MIQRPPQRVGLKVVSYPVKVRFVSDDVLVVVALPETPRKWGPSVISHAHDVLVGGA